jgi:hypothetical protein
MALPAIIVPRDSIGSRLGTGIGHGLEQLAHNKMQQFAQQQQQKQNSALIDTSFPDASPAVREFLKAQSGDNLFKAVQAFAESGLLSSSQEQQQSASPTQESMQSLNSTEQQQPQMNTQQLLDMLGVKLPGDLRQFGEQAPQMTQQQHPGASGAPQQAQSPKNYAEGKKPSIAEAIANYQTPQMKQAERQFQAKQAQQEKFARFKETKAERKEIIDKFKEGREELHNLNRMEDLETEGKLDTPGYVEFLKRAGLDIPSLMNPDSQEFQKIAANFLRNAKTYFGARVSNYEVEQFLKTIPSLSQSPEGRKRVISHLKHFARAKMEYYNAFKEVMKENERIPPFDLTEQVEEKVEKKMDALSELFKKDLAKPVPEAQNKLTTALQATLGDIVGRLGGALKGAAKGAALGYGYGKLGGPIGAAGGTGIGAILGATGVI